MSKKTAKIPFNIIFEIFPDPVLILDKKELKVVTCNQETQDLLKKK